MDVKLVFLPFCAHILSEVTDLPVRDSEKSLDAVALQFSIYLSLTPKEADICEILCPII